MSDQRRKIRHGALGAGVAWVAGALSIVLLEVERRLAVLHPASLLFIILILLAFVPGIVAVATAAGRLVLGRWRNIAWRWTFAAVVPGLVWIAGAIYAVHQFNRRDIPRTWALRVIEIAGASVMEARAVYLSSGRVETPRLVMFYDAGVTDPRGDAEAMDRHVAEMERLTGLTLRSKIFYVRGPMFSGRHVSFRGLAYGSAQSPARYVDRHELAHALIGQHEVPDSYPPTLLVEGWAESQSNTSQDLARGALHQREMVAQWAAHFARMDAEGRQNFREKLADPEGLGRLLELAADHDGAVPCWLRELSSRNWYAHDNGAVYPIGGAFCDFVLRRYGAGRFVQLYFAARPGAFEADCARILGEDLDTLERDFWRDEERAAGG